LNDELVKKICSTNSVIIAPTGFCFCSIKTYANNYNSYMYLFMHHSNVIVLAGRTTMACQRTAHCWVRLKQPLSNSAVAIRLSLFSTRAELSKSLPSNLTRHRCLEIFYRSIWDLFQIEFKIKMCKMIAATILWYLRLHKNYLIVHLLL